MGLIMHRVTSAMEVVSAILATDSRGGYDAVHKNESPNLGLSCARAAVQAHSLKQKLKDQLLECVWVAGDWNLSDCLTKKQQECRKGMIKFLELRVWRLRFDPEFILFAKKSRSAVKQVIEEHRSHEETLNGYLNSLRCKAMERTHAE